MVQIVDDQDSTITIWARSTAVAARCPGCGQTSGRLHGWHHRTPQDLPSIGQTVRLALQVRRFRCLNAVCPRQTFVEQFPDWLPVYARRTTRLTELLRWVAFEVGGETGQRIVKHLKITASADTMLRVIRQTAVLPPSAVHVLGIDDWAMKRGCRYGTILVDLERHAVIDLLPERTAASIAEWLKPKSSVAIITRDRSTEYMAGIQAGAPQALQVADRWHLLLNLRQMLERWLTTVYSQLRQLPIAAQHGQALCPKRSAFARTRTEQAMSLARRECRLARYQQIQKLRQAGYTIAGIVQLTGLHPQTVRRSFYPVAFPERTPRQSVSSILDPYLPYLEQRQRAGCENASQLWREIQSLGYTGSSRPVSKWMHLRRTQTAPTTPKRYTGQTTVASTAPKAALPSVKQLAWLMVKAPEKLTGEERLILEHLRQKAELGPVYALAQQFVTMVTQRLVDQLDPWLHTGSTSCVAQVKYFALGLQQDYDAVRAALATSWSNGQTEGQVNRLKFIKRQMYGRANFDLLRLRALHPP